MNRKTYLFSLFTLALLMAASAWSGEAAHRGFKLTGVFSDMRYAGEGGDVLGQEVFIVYSKDGYFAVLQSSEGEPGKPVIVPAILVGASVTFRVPGDVDGRGEFHGVISKDRLIGRFEGNGQVVDLMRRSSYWQ